jgi:F-type H+-transporting ATPase subunit epsilon
MAGNIQLEIVTPEESVIDEQVQIVISPGTLGDFGVLIGHTPFMTTLRTGAIGYTDSEGEERVVFVAGGFAEALPDKVTVLAETAERRRDIDIERATLAKERAEKRLETDKYSSENIDFHRAKAALERALLRIKIAETRGR